MSFYENDRCPHYGAVKPSNHRPLTLKQARLYAYLVNYIAANNCAPSFFDIAGHFDFASLATVHEHLSNLERKGWIRRAYNEARAIECLVPLSTEKVA